MNKFINWLKYPIVELMSVAFQLFVIYKFGTASIKFFTQDEVESTTSIVGQFFGTRASLVTLGVIYGFLTILIAVSLVQLWVKRERTLNDVSMVSSFAVIGYTFWTAVLFMPDAIGKIMLIVFYATGISGVWLRNKLITRTKPLERSIDE